MNPPRTLKVFALALATICPTALHAQESALKFRDYEPPTISGSYVLSITPTTKLRVACDNGFIEINFATGAVTIPEGTKMPAAARAFWEETVKAFPEFRKAIIEGEKAPQNQTKKKAQP